MDCELFAADFEVFGKVQGVSFRKYAVLAAEKFNVRGWCKNTPEGTVQGHIEGSPGQVELMKEWLRKEGSPYSKTERAEFANETKLEKYKFDKFTSME